METFEQFVATEGNIAQFFQTLLHRIGCTHTTDIIKDEPLKSADGKLKGVKAVVKEAVQLSLKTEIYSQFHAKGNSDIY